uniref:Putative sugar-binding protein n=3 Tax=termite gut metagenome TaxID=433724 RepID=S0DDM9_9ZZZZ
MKNMNFIKHSMIFGLMVAVVSLASCKKDENAGNSLAPVIRGVHLEDAQSSVPDRLVDFARLGQTIRLDGANFLGVYKVYINGYDCAFNSTLVSDNSMIVSVDSKVPTMDADPAVRNTITVEKKNGKSTTIDFEIRASAPSISGVSHTMPQAGDVITITGAGLQGVTQVLFPGNISGTDITSDDEDGEWCRVTVPSGITTSGSLFVTGANGGAYSSASFNFKEGLLHNFDDVQNYAWGSGVDNTPLTDVIPASGDMPRSQGGYQVFNATGNLAGSSDQRFWLNSTNVMTIMGVIPTSTSTDNCGIQMDIYVEGAWNSGVIRFAMADGWGASRYSMLYQPVYVNGTTYDQAAFVNPGCWFTITLPFSLSDDFGGKSIGDVIAQMNLASYKQAGPWFENSGISGVFDPVPATEKVYFDNIRVVPLNVPAYSDFPDEEETE